MTCNCTPSTNIVCSSNGPLNTFTVAQPRCVILPSGETMPNPYFDSQSNLSFWGYKVILGCLPGFETAVSDIYIPIYENIFPGNILLFERILSCGTFEVIPFDFQPPPGVPPIQGFEFLHITVNDRYTMASSANYVLQILGDFPPTTEPIFLQTSQGIFEFENYLVPGSPEQPNLTITNTPEVIILNNRATIRYEVVVTNTGNVPLTDISFSDVINYAAANIAIGRVDVNRPEINIDLSIPGMIRLNGFFGGLSPGEPLLIEYFVEIAQFNFPNRYTFNSTTQVASGEIFTSINTVVQIEVVEFLTGEQPPEILSIEGITINQFQTTPPCNVTSINSAQLVYSITSVPTSPESLIITEASIVIPSEVVIRFTNFGNCTAVFSDTLEPVILNTNITDRTILLSCLSDLPTNSTINHTIDIELVSTTAVTTSPVGIVSTIENVLLQNPSGQILLGVSPIPNSTTLFVGGDVMCSNPCNGNNL